MHKTNRALLAALFIALAGHAPAHAQTVTEVNERLDSLFGEHESYRKFFETLKSAVADDDKKTIASMVDYPFQARIGNRTIKVTDRKHFMSRYDTIVTAKVGQAVTNQTYASLFANDQGVMIGDGEIWFSGICEDEACEKQTIRITAIND